MRREVEVLRVILDVLIGIFLIYDRELNLILLLFVQIIEICVG